MSDGRTPRLSTQELAERLAARSPLPLPALERAAERVLEEERLRLASGGQASTADMLVARALKLVALSGPAQAALFPDESPFPQVTAPPESTGEAGPFDAPPAEEPVAAPPPVLPGRPGPFESALLAEPEAPGPAELTGDAFDGEPRRRRLLPLLAVVALVALGGVAAYVSGLLDPLLGRSGPATPAAVAQPTALPVPEPTVAATEAPAAAPTEEPAAAPSAVPEVVPTELPTAVPQPTTVPPPRVPREPAGGSSRSATAGPARVQSRVPTFATVDWTGAPFFAIHFTSYGEVANAQRDATALSAREGMAARVLRAEIDGTTWYRVMLGQFASAEEALGVRNELAARGTADLGFVYRVVPRR